MKFVAFVLPILFLVGCETMRMQSYCEKIDWEKIGEQAGLLGASRLSPQYDDLIRRCVEAERPVNLVQVTAGIQKGLSHYCSPDVARARGLDGLTFDYSVCKNAKLKTLKTSYLKGVDTFCREGGYKAGLSGQKIEVTCASSFKKTFDAEYQRGKVDALDKRLQDTEQSIEVLKSKVIDLEYENERLQRSNSNLESEKNYLEDEIRRLKNFREN